MQVGTEIGKMTRKLFTGFSKKPSSPTAWYIAGRGLLLAAVVRR
jgi:hypothetical protein